VLLLVGLAAIAVGVAYLTIAANKLPSFMGRLADETGHRTERGEIALPRGRPC